MRRRWCAGAGLSSSAAIVVASALAVLAAAGHTALSKADLAEFTCTCERYVGTMSGGMDQAIAVMGARGRAMHVQFNPVRAEPVVLPPGAAFVIAHSLTPSNKAETASKRYNLRVVECRLAAILMALAMGEEPSKARGMRTLRDVEALMGVPEEVGEDIRCYEARRALKGHYTRAEVEEALGCSLEEVFQDSPPALRVVADLPPDYDFPLKRRALHVYSETDRVLAFQSICNHAQMAPAEKLLNLGKLLTASHHSCDAFYDCSSAELNELVGVQRGALALGARLTGAGWGGCTVALVEEHMVEPFLQKVRQEFY